MLFLLILSLVSCDRFFSTNIGELLKQPRDYLGKKVTISVVLISLPRLIGRA